MTIVRLQASVAVILPVGAAVNGLLGVQLLHPVSATSLRAFQTDLSYSGAAREPRRCLYQPSIPFGARASNS